MINDWIEKYRIVRRILVLIFTYVFLRITMNIFTGKVCLSPYMNIAYGTFAGLVTLILKFYLQGGKDEADND